MVYTLYIICENYYIGVAFTIFAGISQFERDLISQRTIEGLNAARAKRKMADGQK